MRQISLVATDQFTAAGAGFAALNDSLRVVQARQLADALRPQ